jgi:phosphatidylglycerol:prolipoprotein diacylglycerol transferase
MHPELFEIPFTHITIKSYGTMMVIGFIAALWVMRRLMKKSHQNPDFITNIAMYALIAGIVGARVFYVIHHHDLFVGRFWEVFAVWRGGLEFLGGFLCAVVFAWLYLWKQKLPKRLYLDILAIGLMVGLGFGRIGCFLNGCCFGKPANVPWAVTFPYGSPAFYSQIRPDFARNRGKALLDLPDDYFDADGFLKPYDDLTLEQQQAVQPGGRYCTLPVHPTQLYSSLNAFILAGILLLVWLKIGRKKPGVVLSLMLILYGATRFYIETLRADNPFEYAWWAVYKGGTVSQNIGIYLIIIGVVLLAIFATRKTVEEDKPKITLSGIKK